MYRGRGETCTWPLDSMIYCCEWSAFRHAGRLAFVHDVMQFRRLRMYRLQHGACSTLRVKRATKHHTHWKHEIVIVITVLCHDGSSRMARWVTRWPAPRRRIGRRRPGIPERAPPTSQPATDLETSSCLPSVCSVLHEGANVSLARDNAPARSNHASVCHVIWTAE